MRLARNNKRDSNEAAIVKTLRAAGATVVHLDKPMDLLVGYLGRNWLIEVKNPDGRDRMTGEQSDFIGAWRGQVAIVRSEAEALAVIGIVPGGAN